MRANKYIFILLFLSLSGCDKIIDLSPQSNLNTSTYYSNLVEISSALTGCYNGLQKPLLEEWTLTELRSDNAVMGATGSQSQVNRDLSDLDMFFPSTSHAGNYNYWLYTYYNIYATNLVLNALNVNYDSNAGTIGFGDLTIPVKDTDRKKLSAEATFIRAHHYFNLVRLYGAVFLVHEPISPNDAKAVNRSTIDEIYKLIIADLQNTIANGNPAKFSAIASTELGRANAWSAKALLAKVYLTLNKKTEAATLLQDVISNSGYSLNPTYTNIFSINSEMSSEILFSIRFKGGGLGLGNRLPNSFAPLNSGAAVINGDGSGYNYPTSELNNLYTATDIRKSVNIGVYGTGTTAKLYPKKHISVVAIANDAENDWPVIRFADVLLMLAEAQGNSTSSLTAINQVRARAGLSALTAVNISTTAQFETVLNLERRLEFPFENIRWFDILRLNTTFTTLTAEKTMKEHFANMYPTQYALYPAPQVSLIDLQGFANNNRFILPIPQREIDNNTQLKISQNAGY
jgi:hypothetical protein